MKYLIETHGCQMNVHDSERMAGLLEQAGYEPTADDGDADVIVINTCSVRERAEEKLFTRLGEIRQAGNRARRSPGRRRRRLRRAAGRTTDPVALLGRRRHHRNTESSSACRCSSSRRRRPAREPERSSISIRSTTSRFLWVSRGASDRFKAYVTIIEGCNEFCAFCVVPYTRGHERMRPASAIVAEARQAVGEGALEIQLLGQIVNHYQAPDDPACDFAALLERLNDIDGTRSASGLPAHIHGT